MLDGVLEDVLERLVVLLFGLDHFRPEAPTEDMILSAVAFVEGACILSVQIAHAVGEVCERRLEEQVVVVAEQAACVQAPAVVAFHATQELQEDDAVPIVEEDRRVVVPFGADVVVRAGLEVTVRPSHAATVTAVRPYERRMVRSGTRALRTRHVPGT